MMMMDTRHYSSHGLHLIESYFPLHEQGGFGDVIFKRMNAFIVIIIFLIIVSYIVFVGNSFLIIKINVVFVGN